MSILSRLFGAGAAPEATSETYEGFKITPEPARQGGKYRIGAKIEKDGKTHHLIRADVIDGLEDANLASIGKAKQMIDEQGERLFN
jgi:hypothetical protein